MKIKGLTIIAFLCFGLVIWINFIDFKFIELIEGKGTKAEYLIESFCLSFIAAYIFYFFNIYIPEKNEKKLILPFVASNVRSLVLNNYSIVRRLKPDSSANFKQSPSSEEFKALLSQDTPFNTNPMYFKVENWHTLHKRIKEETFNTIDKIFLSGKHLDDRLRRILLDVRFSLFFKDDFAFSSEDFSDKTLPNYQLVFANHFKLIDELNEYYIDNLKAYNSNPLLKSKGKKTSIKVKEIHLE